MGAPPSAEHFHEILHDLIREIPGTANISENIWIWSRGKTTPETVVSTAHQA